MNPGYLLEFDRDLEVPDHLAWDGQVRCVERIGCHGQLHVHRLRAIDDEPDLGDDGLLGVGELDDGLVLGKDDRLAEEEPGLARFGVVGQRRAGVDVDEHDHTEGWLDLEPKGVRIPAVIAVERTTGRRSRWRSLA